MNAGDRARKVFISYAHESEAHVERVRELWIALRSHGIDAQLDLPAAGQRQDWALWMGHRVREADFVLVVASATYRRRAEGRAAADDGRGVQWEARLIRDAFYSHQDRLDRFVPVVLPGATLGDVPDFLAPATTTVYQVDDFTPAGLEPLLRVLLEQPLEVEPPLGQVPVLPPRGHGRPLAPRVREWDPIHLGVQRPMTVDDTDLPTALPLYVPRDHDRRLRDLLGQAHRSLMVVLTGGSSTGKTRALWEAAATVLPDWTLARPRTADELLGTGATLPPRTLLWLDETQRFFQDATEQVAALLLDLLQTPGPVVVLGTMWPRYWEAITSGPASDPYPVTRRLLVDHAVEITVPDTFAGDRNALRHLGELAAQDRRLATAYRSAGADGKVVQVLSGGTLLVQRYERGGNKHGTALISAAMDARGIGYLSPLPAEFLKAAAPAYLTATERAADSGWFADAVAYATEEIRGVAALFPVQVPGGIGPSELYGIHDYLSQYGSLRRGLNPVPPAVWDGLDPYLTEPMDCLRVAAAARRRMLYGRAHRLYQRAWDSGYLAWEDWANMLMGQDRKEEAAEICRAAMSAGTSQPVRILARLLERLGRRDELAELAAAGSGDAAEELAPLLAEQGREPELRALAEAGNPKAAMLLAELLTGRGDHDGAIAIYRSLSDYSATREVARLLARQGMEDELRARAATGDSPAKEELARLLARQGRKAELHSLALAGDYYAAEQLARDREESGDIDGAIAIYDLVEGSGARLRTARLLARHGREDDLRALAQAGEAYAIRELADLFFEEGREHELRALAAESDRYEPQDLLVKLLVREGRHDEAISVYSSLIEAGLTYRGRDLVELLAELGRDQELLDLAEKGDEWAEKALAELLAAQGREDELRRLALGGSRSAIRELSFLAYDTAKHGLNPDGSTAGG
ncbi:hypothetical protein H4696_007514 [Amycolatopsis lexingtonensis]|uniref:SEFIR domain-containing protein n=1 Tax=Amycolatopsis lexingtonensis TaxID=218822 RepID=A0ABR9IB84_9PSEU|nr:SEFIR domain-containing protein [Amycolatopsis lexingtonensis]MBE1500414.1 hypothetical protein [Amycolatopsis lexingtonensis]